MSIRVDSKKTGSRCDGCHKAPASMHLWIGGSVHALCDECSQKVVRELSRDNS